MTPREHMAEAIDNALDAGEYGDTPLYRARRMEAFGKAAGHAFLALELLYDEREAAIQSGRLWHASSERWRYRAMNFAAGLNLAFAMGQQACDLLAWYQRWYPGQAKQTRQLHQSIAKLKAKYKAALRREEAIRQSTRLAMAMGRAACERIAELERQLDWFNQACSRRTVERNDALDLVREHDRRIAVLETLLSKYEGRLDAGQR